MSVQILSRGHDAQGQPFTRGEVYMGERCCIDTGRVVIGCAYVPPPTPMFKHAEHLQAALLEPRTAKPRPLWARVAGAFWGWA